MNWTHSQFQWYKSYGFEFQFVLQLICERNLLVRSGFFVACLYPDMRIATVHKLPTNKTWFDFMKCKSKYSPLPTIRTDLVQSVVCTLGIRSK